MPPHTDRLSARQHVRSLASLVREVFRTRPALFPSGVDLVVIARPGAPDLTFAAASREVEGVASVLARRAREVLRK